MKRRFIFSVVGILALGFLLSACKTTPPPQTKAKSQAIVFIPGYKGSELLDSRNGKVVWILAGKTLTQNDSLAMERPELGITNPVPLRSGKVLEHISIIPGAYGLDPYRGFLKYLRRNFPEAEVFPFAFDWRRDNLDTIGDLDAFLADLQSRGFQKITLIAHSMGGLIATYYLRYGTQLPEHAEENWAGLHRVNAVILAGVPFSGTVSMLGSLQRGTITVRNASLLNPQAVGSFPSAYQLLPPPSANAILSFDGTTLHSVPVYDIQTWENNHWGLLSGLQADDPFYAPRRRFMDENLRRAQAFSEKIHAPFQSYPDKVLHMLNIRGNGFEMQTRYIANRAKLSDLSVVGSGDQAVPFSSTQLPDGFQTALHTREVLIKKSHGELFNDEQARRAIREFLP